MPYRSIASISTVSKKSPAPLQPPHPRINNRSRCVSNNILPNDGFGQGGIASIEDAYFNAWAGLAELPDGSIAAGRAIQEDVTEKFAVWKLGKDGSADPGGPLVLPIAGRATSAIVDGNGLILGGWAFGAKTGTDMVTARLSF